MMDRPKRLSPLRIAGLSALFVLTGATTACSDPWPGTRPDDFSVRYNRDGGMLPHYWQLQLKGLGGQYEERKRQKRIKFSFKISLAEANKIYAVFRNRRFDRIKEENMGRVYDRGGKSISVDFGTTSIRKSNSGRSFVAKSSVEDWRAVTAVLDQLRAKILKDRAKP